MTEEVRPSYPSVKWIEKSYSEWEEKICDKVTWGFYSNEYWGGSDDFKEFLIEKVQSSSTIRRGGKND